MTPSTATTDLFPRVRFPTTLSQALYPTPVRQVSTIINQPIGIVVEHLRSATRGEEGRTAELDPTFEVVDQFCGRLVSVCYTVYPVPGGAQVTASIESAGHSRLDPMTVMAVRFISRRIATDLSKMRDDLE